MDVVMIETLAKKPMDFFRKIRNDLSNGTSVSQIKSKYSWPGIYIWNSIKIIYIRMRRKESKFIVQSCANISYDECDRLHEWMN